MDLQHRSDQDVSRIAGSAMRRGDFRAAREAFGEFVKRRPNHAKAWMCLGECTAKVGFVHEAIECMKRGVELDVSVSAYQSALADLLFAVGDGEGSLDYAHRAVSLDSGNSAAHALLARNLDRLGRTGEAIEYVTGVGTARPGDRRVGLTLGQLYLRCDRYAEARAAFDRIIGELTGSAVGGEDDVLRSALNGLGQVLDRTGDYEEAFSAFEKCGQLTTKSREAAGLDREQAFGRIEAIQRAFSGLGIDRKGVERGVDEGAIFEGPAFLVGFPRSGTTLAEQILGAHGEVVTSGERPILDVTGQAWSRMAVEGAGMGALVESLDTRVIKELRRVYREAAVELVGAEVGGHLLVDKQPLNITDLGIIDLLFPESKVVVMIRDPRDVCLSCFFQDFRLNSSMVQFLSLEGAARYYDAVMGLYSKLREVVGLDIVEIRYEELVSDFENQARKMIEHLGLEWDRGVLRFADRVGKRSTIITTPSAAAVTEGVNRKTVGRWRRYEKWLCDPRVDRYLSGYVGSMGYGR